MVKNNNNNFKSEMFQPSIKLICLCCWVLLIAPVTPKNDNPEVNKRAMAFLNKLIVVSQRANNLKHQQEQEGHSMERIIEVPVVYKTGNNHHPDFEDDINAHQDLVHFPYPLERHDEGVEYGGNGNHKATFWRCYFNAISCF